MRERDYRRDRRADPPKRKRSGRGAIPVIVALVVFAFGLLGMIGLFGGAVRGFLQGAFGFVGYVFFALALLATLFHKVVRKFLSVRTTVFGAIIALLFLAWLQVLTSHAEFAALSEPVSFSAYLNACFDARLGTSGGVLVGWLIYPLLTWIGKYSAIPLAVLFFVVLFFALLPWLRGGAPAAKEDGSPSPRPKKGEKARHAAPSDGDGRLLLFVDKVRPGQRDARKLKFRGIFSKKSPEPLFFDLNDSRPLVAPDGLIPKVRPERYDALRTVAESDRAEEEYDEYLPTASATSRVASRSERSSYEERSSLTADLPPFLRRYREEHVGASDPHSSDSDFARRPASDSDRSASAGRKAEVEPHSTMSLGAAFGLDILPKTVIRKPKASVDDIISDVADLERLRAAEPKAPAREPFLGETATPVTAPARRPDHIESRSVVSPSPQMAPHDHADAPIPEPVRRDPAAEHVASVDPVAATADPAPVVRATSPVSRPLREAPAATITPRDASSMRPVESDVVPPRRVPAPPLTERTEDGPEAPLRTRKPRSDIGGTHRSPESPARSVSSYIPPARIEQPDIEQVMKEEAEAPARPYTPPPVDLLKEFPPVETNEDVEATGEALIAALKSFNIESKIVDHKVGPTFTQYAVTLPDNMSVNKLTPLEKDIKRKLMVDKKDIRIIPSVPNFDAVGIEVPNKVCSTIGLRSIINNPVFDQKNKMMFAIGVDVSGNPVYGNLLKMPHLLVAGATGSGKSVCLNVIICSIMYHYSPEFVRFIMVDPKKVELSVYHGMPHMLFPSPITEPDKAINALSWVVEEMDRRYDLLMNNGCKDIESYNEKMERTGGKKLYYIVFIIDEMADLMYAARKELDEKINRLAAKARAAGINMILATQRPSVDVITGTIKANLRAKIAFKVGSFVDSKTILDRGGAEGLFGNGDMLYMPADGGEPIRLQGPFLDKEIESIVEFIKQHNDCRFDTVAEKTIFASKEPAPADGGAGIDQNDDGEDDLFVPALDYFIECGQASISKLQVKFRIGYGRAARIVAMMEERDYLGGAEGGNKTRFVKITREEFEALYCSDGTSDGGDQQ